MNTLDFAHIASLSVISPVNKGLGFLEQALDPGEIKSLGWSLLKEDLSLPCAVLYEDKLLHNLNWMQQFIDAYGVQLAPHGKTTMAPRLFKCSCREELGESRLQPRIRRLLL